MLNKMKRWLENDLQDEKLFYVVIINAMCTKDKVNFFL